MPLTGRPGMEQRATPAVAVHDPSDPHARVASQAAHRPLRGVRVLDLTTVLSGPVCAYQLAQLGAEVIKGEMPGSGDLARQLGADENLNAQLMGASFLAQNGGKLSVTANLKSEEGRRILRKLARTADVLVENFRPGVMDRLGVGHASLEKVNPALVYCAISGFGQTGPMVGSLDSCRASRKSPTARVAMPSPQCARSIQ